MEDEFVFEILKVMEQNNVILAFNGEFDMRVINALVTSVKGKLNSVESNVFVQKKIYNVMVECLENIFRHSENAVQQNINLRSFAIFTLRREGDDYFLVTGNYVQNKSVDFLKNIIDKINTLNKEQRWEMYRQILANGEFSDKGGAGLGIIDIAIKSGSQLKYDFRKVNDTNTFYVFQVCVHNNNSLSKN
jgi:hypothetical protein